MVTLSTNTICAPGCGFRSTRAAVVDCAVKEPFSGIQVVDPRLNGLPAVRARETPSTVTKGTVATTAIEKEYCWPAVSFLIVCCTAPLGESPPKPDKSRK